MKIVAVEDIHVDGGWDPWTFLKITTDEGIVGWAEFSQARGRRGLPLLVRNLAELIIGEDPCKPARISAMLRARLLAPPEGLQAMAIGAIENACLDISAKALGVPVHAMLGGAMRERMSVYWSHCGMYRARHPKLFREVIGHDPVQSLDDVRALGAEVKAAGFRSLKTNLLSFSVGADGQQTGTLARGSGAIETNVESELVATAVDLMAAFREGAGPETGLMLDLNFGFKPEGFRKFARALEPFDMMWLEVDTLDAEQLALIRRETSTPIASLEIVLGRRNIRPFMEQRSVDVGIIDPVYNGLLESLKMAAMMDAYEINVAAHNSHGPLGALISSTFCALIPNFRILECDFDEVPWRRELLSDPYRVEAGEFVLSQGVGWGSDLVEDVAHRHSLPR